MIYLFIAILAMSGIMLALKFFAVKGINVAQAVMVNYAMALVIVIVSNTEHITAESLRGIFSNNWWYRGILAGIMYFASMDLMAVSTKRVGVSVTTISARLSLILPILFSFIFLGESISVWEAVGIIFVLAALVLIIYTPRDKTAALPAARKNRFLSILMPLLVFVIIGAIAVAMKTTQHSIRVSGNYETDYPLFNLLIFSSAFISAVIFYAATQGAKAFRFSWKSLAGGLCMGTFNYFVTLGIMHGLRFLSTGIFYALYNIGVVIVTTLVGVVVFREKLDTKKIIGICVAIVAIAVFSLPW